MKCCLGDGNSSSCFVGACYENPASNNRGNETSGVKAMKQQEVVPGKASKLQFDKTVPQTDTGE